MENTDILNAEIESIISSFSTEYESDGGLTLSTPDGSFRVRVTPDPYSASPVNEDFFATTFVWVESWEITSVGESSRSDIGFRAASEAMTRWGRGYEDRVARLLRVFYGLDAVVVSVGEYSQFRAVAFIEESVREILGIPSDQVQKAIEGDLSTYRAWAAGEVYSVALERYTEVTTVHVADREGSVILRGDQDAVRAAASLVEGWTLISEVSQEFDELDATGSVYGDSDVLEVVRNMLFDALS